MKKLKRSRVQKSDIIGITGHRSEAGLDPYDSGDEVQQREYSHAIDNHHENAPPLTCISAVSSMKTFDKSTLPPKHFRFFSDETYKMLSSSNQTSSSNNVSMPNPLQSSNPTFNFNNCNVYFGGHTNNDKVIKHKTRRLIITSDEESSQEL